jgi:CRP/FNR family cyclic AMP-dependent transcriptional regulator
MGADLFKNIYLFKDLSSKELELLSEIASIENFNPGDEIFSQGDQAVALFVIKYGTVKISRTGKDNVIDVAQLGTGGHFGEMSFVDGEPRSATVEALERSEIIRIEFSKLRNLFENNPAMAVKFYRALALFLCGRLRVTTMDLSFSREINIRHF